MAQLFKLGRNHDLVNYNGIKFVMTRYQLPPNKNIETMLKHRIPSLPRYIYCLEKQEALYLLRRYEPVKLKSAL